MLSAALSPLRRTFAKKRLPIRLGSLLLLAEGEREENAVSVILDISSAQSCKPSSTSFESFMKTDGMSTVKTSVTKFEKEVLDDEGLGVL